MGTANARAEAAEELEDRSNNGGGNQSTHSEDSLEDTGNKDDSNGLALGNDPNDDNPSVRNQNKSQSEKDNQSESANIKDKEDVMSKNDNEGKITMDKDNSTVGEQRSTRSTRGNVPKRFSDSQYLTLYSVIKAIYAQIVAKYNRSNATVATPQYNIRMGLRIFGQEGVEVGVSKIKDNLIRQDVIKPIKPHDVTRQIKLKALNYLMYLKQKKSKAEDV